MSRCEYPQEVIDYATERALFKAKQAVRRVPSLGEVKDVQQDLQLDVLQRLPNFDGERAGIETFISRVIDNKVASLIDEFRRAWRSGEGKVSSLDDWVLDEDEEEDATWTRRDAAIDAGRLRAHLGVEERRSAQEMVDLKSDVAAVMATLTPELRELCVLMQTQTPQEIVRQTGKAWAVLYKQIAEIREAFQEAQLDLYQ
ncbi:MAG: hypothetical protein FWD53_05760 [Phycisphaerales bacterium]|nr:hypothetical protein [Phycisphaerales bacterium]